MYYTEFFEVLVLLWALHFLLDYPLQGDFMAKAKNPLNPIPGVPWQEPMVAHCFLQATSVWLVTNSWVLFAAEYFVHFATDVSKCRGLIGFRTDQNIHLSSKILWAVAYMQITHGSFM